MHAAAARLGGDEFALLIAGADRATAESVVEKTRRGIQEAFKDGPAAVTCSIGCMAFQTPPSDAAAAIHSAGLLMLRVKRQGKNAIVFDTFHDPVRVPVPRVCAN